MAMKYGPIDELLENDRKPGDLPGDDGFFRQLKTAPFEQGRTQSVMVTLVMNGVM